MIKVGRSRNPDTVVAGREAAGNAVDALKPGVKPSWVLGFFGGKHNPAAMLRGLRSVLGDIPIVGGSAAGTITRSGYGYSGFETAVAVFTDELPAPKILVQTGLDRGEAAAGNALGHQIRQAAAPGCTVLLFYDGVAASNPLRLHPASLLVEGIYQGLGGHPIHLVGGGTLTDMNLTDSYVVDGFNAVKHIAVAIVLPPSLRAETAILHGCVPVSAFMEITRIEGAEVYELDGQPALDMLERMLGLPIGSTHDPLLPMVTLGQKHGDPFGPYDENAYVNRLILQADLKKKSFTLFEPDYTVGTRVQIMSRDNGLMIESVRRGAEQMSARLADRDCLLSLYIDCAGRASARSGAETEEAGTLLDNLTLDAPLIGFYSGVEIAPVNGGSRPLDWTGVLTTLYREGDDDG